ncbi:MAG: serine/threonine-protein kinase [Polyangiaceae bacterium]
MSASPPRGPSASPPPVAEALTIPTDPELANAPTVIATTVATSDRKKRSDPFTLVSGESISPKVDAGGADIEGTAGERRYERGPMIGAGGMGEVRLHMDRRIGRRVAKKTLHSTLESSTARQRFLREARVQGQLEHPAIVPVYDLDIDEEGSAFFTMKRVRGLTLERVLERVRASDPEILRRFSTRKLLTAFAQVCLAVDYAHTRGVIHRDLKPGNIMLGDFGEVYVLDWGLAKVVGELEDDDPDIEPASAPVVGASQALTRGGALLGTPAYMAPEQLLRKTDTLDGRADIFALGAILFEIVARTPFRTNNEVSEITRRVEQGEIIRPGERSPDVAPELDEACARALAPDPSSRPARARDLAEAVERFLDGEQDAAVRKQLAAKHAEIARTAPRVEAYRETMKALALDPDHEDAQKLLVELLTSVSAEVPDAARAELAAATNHARATGARNGMWGLLLWLAILPAVLLIGVLSWPAVLTTAGLTFAAAAFAYWMSRQPSYGTAATAILAVLVAGSVAMTSCYMGPFTVVPTCAATAGMLFTTHTRGRERLLMMTIVLLGALAPFIAEIFGLFPRAYEFHTDRVVLFARAVALPEAATTAAMLYSTLSFTVLGMFIMGRMRDAIADLEERRFVQAWYLRELFPAGRSAPA